MRILLAIDGSECSEEASRAVAARPWPMNTIVRVVSVVRHVRFPPPPPPSWFAHLARRPDDIEHGLRRDASHLVKGVAESLRHGGIAAEVAVLRGDAAAEIVHEADRWRADLIVVGTHGRTGIHRWVLGSVAQQVVRYARCSVEVVRRPERESPGVALEDRESRWARDLAYGGPPP